MKRSLIALAVAAAALASTGCASLTDAGHTSYSLTTKPGTDGKAVYELQVKDGKEYEGRQIQFQTGNGGAALVVGEGQAKAFKGQAIGAKALSVLPVTDLANILTGK